MAITTQDQIVSAFSSGKRHSYDWNKITGATSAYTAGRWYDFSGLNGTPVANAWAGTALNWTACDEATGNGTQIFGIRHGGNVTPDIKHIVTNAALTAVATGVPGFFKLIDICGYYPGINMNVATVQNLVGTPTLRYTNGNGVRAFLSVTTATGATAHNLSMSYTNQAGTSGRTLPVTVSCTASAIVGHITHSGTAANNYGWHLPMANGDFGIRSVQSVQLSAASGAAGVAALVLAREIATIPVLQASVASERDLINQFPSMEIIPDGACLALLYFAGAATATNSNFYGNVQTIWG